MIAVIHLARARQFSARMTVHRERGKCSPPNVDVGYTLSGQRTAVVRLGLRLSSMLRSAARSVGCDQPSDFIDRQHVSIGVIG
jgi:hypothetical protein